MENTPLWVHNNVVFSICQHVFMENIMNSSLKENIKRIAKEKGVKIMQMEKDLGFSEHYISKWDKYSPSIDKVTAVADYLGVSLDTLVGYEGDPDKDLMRLKEMASWLTEDQLVALIAVAEQLKGK